ncbi:hypothetical protein HF888_10195 [Bermanella marisrubri]|uniref:Lipoprotein n=1 Tax=Bermanella marisrubri TaxID=207949 RepID=Q1N5Z6_9GAMM|nr:hypothetical protein [Bermanella marisrubri]EAT13796.1 hypothetical protein RED65_10399 [Oceanobacter sp. RED65] [Bermanella marisrubri]QIZ84565.1 hypothetical protein HF888_10195 [Bermanella marisrubri]
MKMQLKILVSLTFLLVLAACGSEDETLINLDQFKGLELEPELTSDDLVDGNPLYLNYEYTGSMMISSYEEGYDHAFSFSPDKSGLVVMELITSSVEADLRVYVEGDEDGLNLLGIGGGNDILVLQAEKGVTYSVEVSIYLEQLDVEYEYSLIVADANRERLGLAVNEYWLGVSIEGRETCESTNLHETGTEEQSYSLGMIVNIADLYLRSGETKFNLVSLSSNRFEHQGSDKDQFLNTTTTSEFKYQLKIAGETGQVLGRSEYENVEKYNETTTTCIGKDTWSGAVLL